MLALTSAYAHAQSAIASKVVGSDIAAANRQLRRVLPAQRNALDSLRRIAAAATANAPSSPAVLAEVAGASPADTVRAIFGALGQLRATQQVLADVEARQPAGVPRTRVDSSSVASEVIRVVAEAQASGQTNTDRWFLGGQVGLKLYGGGTLGGALLGSARTVYFVPLAPNRRIQLPIVANISDLSTARGTDAEQAVQLRTLLTSADGAFFSVDPTFRAISNAGEDLRVRTALSGGVKINTLKDSSDQDVTLALVRAAVNVDIEIGRRVTGQPPLVLTLRPVYSRVSARDYRRVFGEERSAIPALESFILVPIGGGTGVLTEVTATRRSPPAIRIGFFTQKAAN